MPPKKRKDKKNEKDKKGVREDDVYAKSYKKRDRIKAEKEQPLKRKRGVLEVDSESESELEE